MNVIIDKAINPTKLDAELRNAFPLLIDSSGPLPVARYMLDELSPDHWRLIVPDSINRAALDALIAAHDATAKTPLQQQEGLDSDALAALRAQYQTLKSGLNDIRTDMGTIQGTPNPTVANLASLVQLANGMKLLAANQTKMANGMDRVLDTLAAVVRERAGP